MKRKKFSPQNMAFCAVVLFFLLAVAMGQNSYILFADGIARIGMHGILVLAMLPSICSGMGPNFGVSIGICFGLLGGAIAVECGLSGMAAFALASFLGIGLSVPAGILYGFLLNRVQGSEMTVSTYLGFSTVAFFSILWLCLPFSSPELVWTIGGQGLRNTISLEGSFAGVLDNLVIFTVKGTKFAVGGTLLFFGFLGIAALFLRSRLGTKMQLAGESPLYAQIHGISVRRMRILGSVLSTGLGALGILFYAQGYGFMQLYQAPLYMPFLAVSAALLGGATLRRCSIRNIAAGTVLLQFLFTLSVPVINALLPESTITDAIRILLTYGILLYALLQQRTGREEDCIG